MDRAVPRGALPRSRCWVGYQGRPSVTSQTRSRDSGSPRPIARKAERWAVNTPKILGPPGEEERLFWHAVLMVLAAKRDRRRLKREEET
jgi:hypothetical protein